MTVIITVMDLDSLGHTAWLWRLEFDHMSYSCPECTCVVILKMGPSPS